MTWINLIFILIFKDQLYHYYLPYFHQCRKADKGLLKTVHLQWTEYFTGHNDLFQVFTYLDHKETWRGGSEMATGTQTQTVWAPWIRDLVEMLETHLVDVKHQGGSLPTHWPAGHCHPHTSPLASGSNMLGRPSVDQTEYFPAGATFVKKKKKETKLWNPEPTAHKKLLHAMLYWEYRRAPTSPDAGSNLPRRCRQTGIDAKRATPELLRLKFYCSWTGN
jgi:hypothetical protein